MKCPKCQTENPEARKFCRECGSKLSWLCPKCQSENLPGDKYCGQCGHQLTGPEAAPRLDYSRPKSYTPKFLADKILTSRAALEGERKQVTVLFADLKGSMELIAERDPEEARKLLDPVISRSESSQIIFTIFFMGDGKDDNLAGNNSIICTEVATS
jgi:hypothetical protein